MTRAENSAQVGARAYSVGTLKSVLCRYPKARLEHMKEVNSKRFDVYVYLLFVL